MTTRAGSVRHFSDTADLGSNSLELFEFLGPRPCVQENNTSIAIRLEAIAIKEYDDGAYIFSN